MPSNDNNDCDLRTRRFLSSLMQTDRFRASEVSAEDYREMVNVLAELLVELSGITKCGANWDVVKIFDRSVAAPCAFLPDKKTGTEFILAIDWNSISLTFRLTHFQELRYVDDSFWKLMLSLGKLGEIKYEPSSSPVSSGTEESVLALMRYRKSNIFSVVVDHILFSKEDDPFTSFPNLTLEWPPSYSWTDLFPTLVETVETGWRMNYVLYRSAYQRRHRAVKTSMV